MYSQPGALTVQHDNQQHGGDIMVLGDPATSNGQRKARSVALGLQEPAERTLVEAAKGGHSTAFDTLCERYAQQLLRAAHRITRSREDAEDAVGVKFTLMIPSTRTGTRHSGMCPTPLQTPKTSAISASVRKLSSGQ